MCDWIDSIPLNCVELGILLALFVVLIIMGRK
jgi:hypothetical protein